MISKKAIGILLMAFFSFNIVLAQNAFEVSGVYSLTAEKLTNSNANEYFSYQQFHSFGINGKKIFASNFFVQSGVHVRNFGTKVGVEGVIVDDMPSEMGGQSIDIPINVGFYFLNNDKIRLGISLGVNNGFLRHQYHDYHGFIIESIPVYDDYIFQINSTLELGIKLTDHIILDIKPVFQRQINSNYRDYQQIGMGGQLGLSYDFTKPK